MYLQSTAGYGGLEATPLARPGYYNEIISRIYERDFLAEITNTQIDRRIIECHQKVQIMRAPEVGPWRSYQKNQEIVPNQVTADAISMEICNAAYNAIKIDELDIHFACDRWQMFEEAFLDSIYERWVEMQRRWVFTNMIIETDPKNKGPHAGMFGDIDLGSKGSPIIIDKDNILLHVAQIQRVLMEALRWKQGEMFIVLPIAFRPVLASSQIGFLKNDSCQPCGFGIDGLFNFPIGGFTTVIESTQVPYFVDAAGNVCFYILAGHNSAFAYAADIIKGELVRPDRTFGIEYQMLGVWGGKMLYPDVMTVSYWTFKLS